VSVWRGSGGDRSGPAVYPPVNSRVRFGRGSNRVTMAVSTAVVSPTELGGSGEMGD
jgi:hypothetical protein